MPFSSRRRFDLTPPNAVRHAALAARLSEEARAVLLHQGTEPPFCGGLTDHAEDGVYACGLCGLPLFVSDSKFHSGSGWPSFFEPFVHDHIRFLDDLSHAMRRTEIRCARCDGHLGHVFPDGPPPTHDRYCVNGAALIFIAKRDPLPDLLDRGEPEGLPIS